LDCRAYAPALALPRRPQEVRTRKAVVVLLVDLLDASGTLMGKVGLVYFLVSSKSFEMRVKM
jgi:hypothetical protein